MFLFDERFRTFEAFSLAHGVTIVFIFIVAIILYLKRNNITGKKDLFLRRLIVVCMLSLEWTFYGWSIIVHGFDVGLLPLGMCALSVYFTSYALWTNNEKIFRFIFPWAITGGIISLAVADTTYAFPHFRYFHYFGNHSLFFLGNLYLLWVSKFSLNYRALLKSSLYLALYALIVYPINIFLDSNHLFLREVPSEVAPLYQFLGIFWVFGFAFSIFLMFHIIYAPLVIFKKTRRL